LLKTIKLKLILGKFRLKFLRQKFLWIFNPIRESISNVGVFTNKQPDLDGTINLIGFWREARGIQRFILPRVVGVFTNHQRLNNIGKFKK
jgi:hypothetical protein